MDLEEYLSKFDTNAGLARKLGVSPALVSQWRNGIRPIPFERCPQIESVTNGAVSRADLCPENWATLWPELESIEKCKCQP
ncbi:Putative antitoxin of toxin-antitoxin system, YdaS/YdaT [Nitrosomonas ureae]|uniref:Antitoxin of toxin-antitoxin system, YdaS/YdaT n=2 Tax=Nitrosomonas ureae TaxID=44577 RepID=A0A285BXY3_9PROT|nr:YdaS family helix-turn-helix protein [Nitrosomonas ureae]SNX59748.1 Putative antitoxin of toxin-antitoxin system, YdaS/YdaT [Nitrosomonas ureae]